jgi:hypothetical protein
MEVSGQLHAPVALLSGERAPGTHWIGGWMGPRVGLDAVEKRKIMQCRVSKPDRLARSSTLIPTEGSRLLFPCREITELLIRMSRCHKWVLCRTSKYIGKLKLFWITVQCDNHGSLNGVCFIGLITCVACKITGAGHSLGQYHRYIGS